MAAYWWNYIHSHLTGIARTSNSMEAWYQIDFEYHYGHRSSVKYFVHKGDCTMLEAVVFWCRSKAT